LQETRRSSALGRRFWHIAKFFCNAKLGRYRGVADIEQASPPFNLAEATNWLTEANWEFAVPCPDRLLAGACGQTTDNVALEENSDRHQRSDRRGR
jgi:hypothetical protein